jgi:hypothetical protein
VSVEGLSGMRTSGNGLKKTVTIGFCICPANTLISQIPQIVSTETSSSPGCW